MQFYPFNRFKLFRCFIEQLVKDVPFSCGAIHNVYTVLS